MMHCGDLFKTLLIINLTRTAFCLISHRSVRFSKCSFTRLCESSTSTTTSPKIESGVLLDNSLSSEELPPLPCPKSNPDDDGFRFIRNRLPVSIQNFLRDTGVLRTIMDTLVFIGVPDLLSSYPQAVDDFLRLSDMPLWVRKLATIEKMEEVLVRDTSFTNIRYGDHPMQVLHLMEPKSNTSKGLVVFVHGGAWGSGRPWMYRLVARPFIEQNMAVAVVGYRTWPDVSVSGQVKDLKAALKKLQEYKPQLLHEGTTLMGHSSGAHISLMLCLLDPNVCICHNIQLLVALSGVYCIPTHYEYEAGRGVEELSALKPACGYTVDQWQQNSPIQILPTMDSSLPLRLLLLHGGMDKTVPYKTTLDLANAFRTSKLSTTDCSTSLLPSVGHSETVLHLMVGGETRDVVMEWLLMP